MIGSYCRTDAPALAARVRVLAEVMEAAQRFDEARPIGQQHWSCHEHDRVCATCCACALFTAVRAAVAKLEGM